MITYRHYLITVGDALRALVTVVVAVTADEAAPLRIATGLPVDPVRSSLAFLWVIDSTMKCHCKELYLTVGADFILSYY